MRDGSAAKDNEMNENKILGRAALKARGKNKTVTKHLMMSNERAIAKTDNGWSSVVHGSVPCTRDRLLGADSWALETPILARQQQEQQLAAKPQQPQQRQSDERRGGGQRLNVGAVKSDIACLGALNTRSAEQWSGLNR